MFMTYLSFFEGSGSEGSRPLFLLRVCLAASSSLEWLDGLSIKIISLTNYLNMQLSAAQVENLQKIQMSTRHEIFQINSSYKWCSNSSKSKYVCLFKSWTKYSSQINATWNLNSEVASTTYKWYMISQFVVMLHKLCLWRQSNTFNTVQKAPKDEQIFGILVGCHCQPTLNKNWKFCRL